jgi:hypothetical protein
LQILLLLQHKKQFFEILPVGVDNATIEFTYQNDDILLTMQSHLQHKHAQQDHHNQHMLCQVQLLQLLDNCNSPLHLFDDIIRLSNLHHHGDLKT